MSYLQKKVDAFKTDLTSSSTKINAKRGLVAAASPAASAVRSPTPTPGTPSKSDLKRKRAEAGPTVFSQPADTGTGNNIRTQVTYAVEYLKSKETHQTLSHVLGYLSLKSAESRRNIATILKRHERVEYHADPANSSWDAGTYRFRPIHNIRSGTELLRYLQTQPTAQGLSVRELKDGWSGAEEAITALESRHQILVTRNKKDNHARMVWANDASLTQNVEPEFQVLWFRIALPPRDAVPHELEKAGLKPTSDDPATRVAAPQNLGKKKQKKPRKGGRTTNLHMQGILRDYSGLKK
ncbi:MAG: hypothetical protein M1825_006065 [Sarcosagium campestre]|nr:MAG: hypothetical protein M1825_006065 [Sarcosagium campestre]